MFERAVQAKALELKRILYQKGQDHKELLSFPSVSITASLQSSLERKPCSVVNIFTDENLYYENVRKVNLPITVLNVCHLKDWISHFSTYRFLHLCLTLNV